MSLKYKFPDDTDWQKLPDIKEKIELSDNDEILINSNWAVRKIKAKYFRGSQGEKWKEGEKGKDWINWISIEKITSEKVWKTTTVTIWKSDGTEKKFTIEDWKDWNWAWDMLAANNLSDLKSKVTARENLSIYSKFQTDENLNGKVDKIAGKGLSTHDLTNERKDKIDSFNPFYQKVQDIRDTNRAPNNPFWKNHHIHYGFIQPSKIWLSSSWDWCTIITINAWDSTTPSHYPLHQIAYTIEGMAFRKQKTATEWWDWNYYSLREWIMSSITPAPWDYWGAGIWYIENKTTWNFWKLWMRVRDNDNLWYEFKNSTGWVDHFSFTRQWYFITPWSIFNGWVELLMNTKDGTNRNYPNNQKWRAFVSLSDWLTINYDNDFQKLTLRSDKLIFEALPTSPVWLPTWGIWREWNTLKIVP